MDGVIGNCKNLSASADGAGDGSWRNDSVANGLSSLVRTAVNSWGVGLQASEGSDFWGKGSGGLVGWKNRG